MRLRISPGQLAALYKTCFNLLQRDALFVPAGARHEHVLDVFPKLPMFFQIDLNGQLAAFLIGTN